MFICSRKTILYVEEAKYTNNEIHKKLPVLETPV